MKNLSERIIEVLKATKRISEADIQKALMLYAREGKGKLRDVLVQMGVIGDVELTSLLSVELKIPFLNLAKYQINPDVAKLIPEKLARKYQIIPISKIGNTITLAMADPFNLIAVDDISLLTKSRIDCVISAEKDILTALDKLYVNEQENIHKIAEELGTPDEVEVVKAEDDLDSAFTEAQDSDAPVVKMVDLILKEALRKRASDVHREPV